MIGIQRSSVARISSCACMNLLIALRIDHQRDAHRLHRLMHPGVREHIALVLAVRLAALRLAGFDEVVDAAVAAHGAEYRFARTCAMQCGIQFTISALARSFQNGLSIEYLRV